jgi:hypothetical protein
LQLDENNDRIINEENADVNADEDLTESDK